MSHTNPDPSPDAPSPLLERASYLREITERMSDAEEGHGSVVLLSGNAGIGKTALVRSFEGQVSEQIRVYTGACDALSTTEPLAPLLDIAGAIGPRAAAIVDRTQSRLRRFRSFLALLSDARHPCLIIIEDLHWADDATLDLLRFVGRRIEPCHALIIATYRNDEVGQSHPLRRLVGDLATLGRSFRISLPPLSLDAVDMLAKDTDIDPVELHRLTGGNPFFVTEVLAAGTTGIPATVRDAVLARASRLSDAGRSTLDAAAILGSPGSFELLGRVIEPGQDRIDECVNAGMLVEQGESYIFRHEIARQTILEALMPRNRTELHRRAFVELERSSDHRSRLARLAYHAEESGQWESVLQYAPAAAEEATKLNAHREAGAQYARALRFADRLPPEGRATILERYAEECHHTDQLDASIQARYDALDIRRRIGTPLKEGENLFRLARTLVLAGRNAEAESASQDAMAVLESQPTSPELASAYQIQAHLRMLNRDNKDAIRMGLQAIEVAKKIGANEALIYAHNTVGSAMMLTNENEGRKYLEQSVQMAHDSDLGEYAGSAYGNLGSASGELYLFEQADHYLAEGIAYCAERDLDFELHYMMAWQSLSHLYQGRWDEAADVASQLLRRPNLALISQIMARVALGRVRARRGDPEAMAILDLALASARQTATLQRLGPVHAARAEAAWLSGDINQTIEESRAVFELAVNQDHPWFVGELAYWRWKAGDLDDVPDVAAQPFVLQLDGKWADAATLWQQRKCPYESARALAESEDESALRQAFNAFDALGAAPARAGVARRLRELGVQVIPRGARPSTRANPANLTRRQIEVAELIVEGCTNNQIAERLFISPKTVEHHLTALFTKLGVDNRSDAAARLKKFGINSPN